MEKRFEFAKYIKENNIKGSDILFTDESRFSIACVPNRQIDQIRLTGGAKEAIKDGVESEDIHKRVYFHTAQHPLDLMVAGGVGAYGLTELIFIIGNMNGFAYRQAIDYYKSDIDSEPLNQAPKFINNLEN